MIRVDELPVHRTAIASMYQPDPDLGGYFEDSDQVGQVLHPALVVWTSLDPAYAQDLLDDEDEGTLRRLNLVDAEPVRGTNQIRLTLSDIRADEFDRDQDAWVSLLLPHASVAVWHVLALPGLQFRLLLCDGAVPALPENAVLSGDDGPVAVASDPDLLGAALAGTISHAWAGVAALGAQAQELGADTSGRVMLWQIASGIALGSTSAFNQLLALAQHVEAAQTDGPLSSVVPMGIAAEDLVSQVLEALEALGAPELSLEDLPAPMEPLRSLVDEYVSVGALTSLDSEEVDFLEIVGQFGWTDTLVAAGVYAAWAGRVCADQINATGLDEPSTPSYLLARLVAPEQDPAEWAVGAVGPLMLEHDTTVLTDLLTASSLDSGDLLPNYAHLLAAALHDFAATGEDVADVFAHSEIKPANHEDMVTFAARLLAIPNPPEAAAADAGACPVCGSLETLHDQDGWEAARLAAAAAPILPLLADFDAAHSGHQVGDEDWVEHRGDYLYRWLTGTAHP